MAKVEEQRDFDAARTVQALCLAAEEGDLESLTRLWGAEREIDEWKAIAEQAICALLGAMRVQARGAGVSSGEFYRSSIKAMLFLEARGAPPAGLELPRREPI